MTVPVASTLIVPSRACQRLKHRTDTRLRQTGPGRYEYCAVCTLGYAMALEKYGGDTERADQFVKELRRW